jgi:cytochrome c oxidase cbb3-type subunit 2
MTDPQPGPVAPWRVLSRRALAGMIVVPVAFVLGSYGTAVVVHDRLSRKDDSVAVASRVPPDGGRLFVQHCANCHGVRGDGNGPAHLEPRARYFGFDRFKFASTDTGVPTDDDLLRVLERGIPGSAMYSFSYLPEADRRAIVGHVRTLALRGTYDRLAAKVIKDGDDPDPAELSGKAAEQCVPGKPLAIPPAFPPASPEAVARGRQTFQTTCAQCHGPEGKGDGPQVADMKNENGTPNRPRNLTLGLYKYGGDPASLYVRLRLGIPGTPMPASPALTDAQVFDLIHFVRSLADAGP